MQKFVDVSRAGYTPIAVTFCYISDSTRLLPTAIINNNDVIVNVYRATTAAYSGASSGDDLKLRVWYASS